MKLTTTDCRSRKTFSGRKVTGGEEKSHSLTNGGADAWKLQSSLLALESSLEMLVEARGLQRPVLLLRREEQAGSVGEGQRLSRSVKESLLTPARAEEKRENEVNYETYLKEEEVPHIWQQLVSKFQRVGVVRKRQLSTNEEFLTCALDLPHSTYYITAGRRGGKEPGGKFLIMAPPSVLMLLMVVAVVTGARAASEENELDYGVRPLSESVNDLFREVSLLRRRITELSNRLANLEPFLRRHGYREEGEERARGDRAHAPQILRGEVASLAQYTARTPPRGSRVVSRRRVRVKSGGVKLIQREIDTLTH
ncbi:hypothetical protein F7725_005563 [Dissostichus mawsoni]|uniref:Uncharacterized protein n=1 Tax=Dissostichus mawsoni TaxID=36200 RepID=A0A7J5YVR2_DISMA|nr:hypothetical protein F7725_005563 [Dissostichus mawsoni]